MCAALLCASLWSHGLGRFVQCAFPPLHAPTAASLCRIVPINCTTYDLPVPAILSSLIPIVGILLNLLLLLPAELDLVELGDEA
jgi:hypothetical protein